MPTYATVLDLPTLHQPSDGVLAARAIQGDRAAEAAIYRRYVGFITNLCLRLLGDRADAEVVAQDTFVDVLEQLATLREPARLRHWMSRIAVHKVHRKFRRRRLLRALGLWSPATADVELLPAHADASAEQVAKLQRLGAVLQRLPDAQRVAWTLRYVDGYKLEEMASACGCSLASIKRRLASAEAVVRTHIHVEEADHV